MPFNLKTVMKMNAKVCQPLCAKTPGAEGQSPGSEARCVQPENRGAWIWEQVLPCCGGPVLATPLLTFDLQVTMG